MKRSVFVMPALSLLLCLSEISTTNSVRASEGYQAIFSRAVLEKAKPEERARLLELEARNRARWDESNANDQGHNNSNSDVASQGIYKHVDAEGNVVFGDSAPVAGAQSLQLKIRKPDENSLQQHRRMLEDQEHALALFEDEKRLREKQAARQRESEVARHEHKRQCFEMQNEIADYNRGGTVYYELDEKGERRYFSDQELKQKVAGLETDYNKYCN